MFIHSHVSDDYLLKELTIPCNLPSKSTFVHHIQLDQLEQENKNRVQIKYIFEMKRNEMDREKKDEENYVWRERESLL